MAATPFNPANHLTKVSGNDYLQVKWRIVWLRSEHPGAHVVTELVELRDGGAVFKATVTLPSDGATGGVAVGHGMCTSEEFNDYMEKAETKAIGRALAVLGYGTQFTGREIDEGGVADASANKQQRQQSGAARQSGQQSNAGITDPQKRKILALGDHVFDMGEDEIDAWIAEHFNGATLNTLSKRDASALITAWEQDANR